MAKRSTRVGVGAGICETFAALAWGPKTQAELQAYTGANRGTVRKRLAAMRAAGLVRAAGNKRSESSPQRVSILWALTVKPFSEEVRT